ncbi:probable RNA-directed DNA polymerase from transposon X-element [Trichonephila clavipes]|nr:probable RNA-directed DNA polymerase from transposon X-element [Trichonephila clavipes]
MQSTPRGVATVATPEARSTSEIENEVRELTSEILTAHGNASKPVTHSEVPFVQDNKYGRNTLPLWILRTDPFGEPPKRSEGRPPRSQPLMALPNPHKDEYITNTVDAYFTANTNNTDQIPPALPSEVIFYIKRLKYFPSAWKTAVVVPILKPGKDPTLAESHRPISLLPILSKLAEKIISTRLNDFLETNKILIPEQHGFRPRLSTTHQLLRVVEYIKEGNNMGQCTAAVFLDIQKAFDRVWHTGLLFKLINYNIPTPLILLLNSYISNRSFTVKINRTYSQTRSISAGVAQGSILGPVLFNLYVNDILKSTKTMLCMYADDTAILSRHKNLNTLVENINEHLAHLEI